jgi:lipopolysaccharide transport system permease protein
MYTLVDSYRRILLETQTPDWAALGVYAAVAAAAFFGGYACFHKLRKTFADVI